jgi:hypothetical protein
MPLVEQNNLKRSGIGLRACDHERAFPGYTLFAPRSGGGKVYLIDLDGNLDASSRSPAKANWFGSTSIPISAKGRTEQTIAFFAPTDTAPRKSRGRKRRAARNETTVATGHPLRYPRTKFVLKIYRRGTEGAEKRIFYQKYSELWDLCDFVVTPLS